MYILLKKKKYKDVKELISVASFDSCQAIVDAAIARDDQRLLLNIKGVDLIAKEAKYHGKCRSKYVSKTNLKCLSYKEDKEEEECMYSAAFAMLVDEINPGLSEGKIYDMSHLLDRYKQVLEVKGISCSNYRSEKLKRKNERPFLRPNSHREAEQPFEARINLFQSFVSCRHSKNISLSAVQ